MYLTNVYKSNVTLYLAQQTSLQLGRFAMLYTYLYYMYLYLEFSLAQERSLQLRQTCIALRATVYTGLIVTLYLAQKTSLQLGRFAMLYTLCVYKFNCNHVFIVTFAMLYFYKHLVFSKQVYS